MINEDEFPVIFLLIKKYSIKLNLPGVI